MAREVTSAFRIMDRTPFEHVWGMIPKSGTRFSEKITLNNKLERDDDSKIKSSRSSDELPHDETRLLSERPGCLRGRVQVRPRHARTYVDRLAAGFDRWSV